MGQQQSTANPNPIPNLFQNIKANASQSNPADLLSNLVGSHSQFFNRTDEVNELLQKGNKAVACGPSCQNQQTTNSLQQKLTDAQTNLITAPDQITTAAKNYYTYTEGPAGYDKYNKAQLTEKAAELAKQMTTDFNKNMKQATLLNTDYNTTYINSLHTQELYENYLKKNADLDGQIKKLSGDVFTNDRKTHYEDQEIYNQKWWYVFMAWIYGIIVVSFFFAMFLSPSSPNYSLRWKIVILLCLVIYPFICTTVTLYLIRGIHYGWSFLPKNVYL
jgi:hypothetical protein